MVWSCCARGVDFVSVSWSSIHFWKQDAALDSLVGVVLFHDPGVAGSGVEKGFSEVLETLLTQ